MSTTIPPPPPRPRPEWKPPEYAPSPLLEMQAGQIGSALVHIGNLLERIADALEKRERPAPEPEPEQPHPAPKYFGAE